MTELPLYDHRLLLELAAMRMPFGKYAGRRLIDLPEPYVVWFARQGFPEGKAGGDAADGLRDQGQRPGVPVCAAAYFQHLIKHILTPPFSESFLPVDCLISSLP